MRKLIYIPILHTEADMGSLAGPMKQQFTQKFGSNLWNQRAKLVEELWDGIEAKLDELKLNFKKTKIYQDGLPICGKEIDIINTLAKNGSRNHVIIKKLMGKGVEIVGTEDPKLLLEEYNFIKETIKRKTSPLRPLYFWFLKKKGEKLLLQRDQFIAKRIHETLESGAVGIVFIGLVHKMNQYLPQDMQVEYLI